MFDTAIEINELVESYSVFFVALAIMQFVFLIGYLIMKLKRG